MSPRGGVAALLLLSALASAPELPVPTAPVEPTGAIPGDGMTLETRLVPPAGFQRPEVPADSFAAWLRAIPLMPEGHPVHLYDGTLKGRQDVHFAVLDRNPGPRDLQHCADAVIRLRAEYLRTVGRIHDLRFHFTSGHEVSFERWARGERPRVSGRQLHWTTGGRRGTDDANFTAWLETLYAYAGTRSLERELQPVGAGEPLQPGDVFIRGGSPGHAILVVDVVRSRDGTRTRFALAQSYMPAQEIHVLRNPQDRRGGPWYDLDFGPVLYTPEWRFGANELRRFRP